MGRERDQAISAEDYKRADELKAQIDERRAQQEGRKEARSRAPEVTVEDIADMVCAGHRASRFTADPGGARPAPEARGTPA